MSVLSEADGPSWFKINFLIVVSISDTFSTSDIRLRFLLGRRSYEHTRKIQMKKQSKNQVGHVTHSHQLNK